MAKMYASAVIALECILQRRTGVLCQNVDFPLMASAKTTLCSFVKDSYKETRISIERKRDSERERDYKGKII